MKLQIVVGTVSALSLSACVQGPQDIVPKPTDIDIGTAIMQVRDGLVAAQQMSATTGKFAGLYPCTAQIVFNVTAKADRSNTLVLDAAIKPPSALAPSISVSDTFKQNSEASRGNQITIMLTSSLCIPAGQTASAAEVAKKPAKPPVNPVPPLMGPLPLFVNPPTAIW